MKLAVFTFGRFNPPTIGHYKLLKQVESVADNYDADMFVCPSRKVSKKDPLKVDKKVEFMKLSFPEYSSSIVDNNSIKTILEASSWLYKKNYDKIIAVFGSDRVSAFDVLLNRYNDAKGSHGYYDFEEIKTVSAGHRDPDAEGVAGMSASKLRSYAFDDDYNSFRKGTSENLSDKDSYRMFLSVRVGLGLRENIFYERELTSKEKKKKEEIVLALKRKNPNWSKDKLYAIATSQAKKFFEINTENNTRKFVGFGDFVSNITNIKE